MDGSGVTKLIGNYCLNCLLNKQLLFDYINSQ